MTDKLYYIDGYLRETEATVVSVTEKGIILNRTVFYPEGGGQPGDRGWFGTFHIIDTQKDEDGNPLHIIKGDKPSVGEKAVLRLDWDHRFFYMKEHSAQHLVSALLFSKHGIGTVAVHQGEDFFSVETDKDDIPEEVLLCTEDEANEAIRENHGIEQREMSHEEAEALGMRRSIKVEGNVKVVFIEDLDAVACGGVHLHSTGEIGELQYYGSERIRGHVRTMWKCSDLSVAYRRENRAIVNAACSCLSSEPVSVLSSIERILDENSLLKRKLKNAEEKIAGLELDAHKGTAGAVVFGTSVPVSSFEDVLSSLGERNAFIIDADGRFMFHGTGDLFNDLKTGLDAYSLRGGGREWFYRGSVKGPVNSVLEEAQRLLNG